jgi:hypothetical protein
MAMLYIAPEDTGEANPDHTFDTTRVKLGINADLDSLADVLDSVGDECAPGVRVQKRDPSDMGDSPI